MESPVKIWIARFLAVYTIAVTCLAGCVATMHAGSPPNERITPTPPSYLFRAPPAHEYPPHLFGETVVPIYNQRSMGSGFIVWIDELRVYVMTALHVVDENIGRASLPTVNGQTASILAIAPQHDLALLVVPNTGRYTRTLKFASCKVGDDVRAVGYSRWAGRQVRLIHYGKVVSTDFLNWMGSWTVTHNAGVRGGLSGGPLLNTQGDVVGVASFFADKGIRVPEANSSEVCSVPGVTARQFLMMVLPCTR
jgi:S1-C subfamily serine protease